MDPALDPEKKLMQILDEAEVSGKARHEALQAIRALVEAAKPRAGPAIGSRQISGTGSRPTSATRSQTGSNTSAAPVFSEYIVSTLRSYRWKPAPTQFFLWYDQSFILPALGSSMNCMEMVLLVLYMRHDISKEDIMTNYPKSPTDTANRPTSQQEMAFLEMVPGPPDIRHDGTIVAWYVENIGLAHVVMCTDVDLCISFWGPKNPPPDMARMVGPRVKWMPLSRFEQPEIPMDTEAALAPGHEDPGNARFGWGKVDGSLDSWGNRMLNPHNAGRFQEFVDGIPRAGREPNLSYFESIAMKLAAPSRLLARSAMWHSNKFARQQ